MMMKKMIGFRTLTSSSSSTTKIILEDFPFRSGTEFFSSVPRKTFQLNFLRLDSVQSRFLKPIPLRSSSIQVSQVNIEAVENAPRKTVRVRFQMQKECVFGEHFFILGDDSVFGGLWDPETALPMNWSDGHVWTIDLDLPVGRLVEFKFILKAKTGEFLWQPGPNRAIETWESDKTIRVCEDWENADLQMMIEEDFVPVNQEEKQQPKQGVRFNTEEEDQVLGTVQQNPSVVVVENAGHVSDESEDISSSYIESERSMKSSNGALTAREVNVTKDAMFTEEEGPVLVPGLFPLSELENEEASGSSTPVSGEVINEGKAKTFLEVDKKQETREERNKKGKVKAISVFENSEQEEVNSIEQRHHDAVEEEMQQQDRLEIVAVGRPNVVLEKDIQWGRRMLYKLLSSFGLF